MTDPVLESPAREPVRAHGTIDEDLRHFALGKAVTRYQRMKSCLVPEPQYELEHEITQQANAMALARVLSEFAAGLP